MAETPPPLDNQTPDPAAASYPMLRFAGGVLLGGVVTVATVFLAVIVLVSAFNDGSAALPVAGYVLPFVGPLAVIGGGLFLAGRNRARPAFGLGVAASVPITVATVFIICGGIR